MTTPQQRHFVFTIWACLLVLNVGAQSYTSWYNGDTTDIVTIPQKGTVLAGGGTDNDDAMRWMLNRASGGDVLIIRASGSNGYNDYFYSELGVFVNSVQTIRFDAAAAAQDAYVIQQIRNAEVLFLAGGDQYDYYNYWKDTPIEDAINYLINEKHAVVGGTSAGMAVLSQAYYTPPGSGIVSADALANPFHPSMNIIGNGDFIINPLLANVITDTHYEQRSRKGRHMAFMARVADAAGSRSFGIACNETTAVCIDEAGIAHVFGDAALDDAFFLQTTCRDTFLPEVLQLAQPLTWNLDHKAVLVCKVQGTVSGGNTFNLNDWESATGNTWEYWSVTAGSLLIEAVPNGNCLGIVNTVTEVNNGSVKFYPNPTHGQLFIRGDVVIGQLQLSDLLGRTLQTWPGNVDSIDLSNLPAGQYLLRYEVGDKFFQQRVVKM